MSRINMVNHGEGVLRYEWHQTYKCGCNFYKSYEAGHKGSFTEAQKMEKKLRNFQCPACSGEIPKAKIRPFVKRRDHPSNFVIGPKGAPRPEYKPHSKNQKRCDK